MSKIWDQLMFRNLQKIPIDNTRDNGTLERNVYRDQSQTYRYLNKNLKFSELPLTAPHVLANQNISQCSQNTVRKPLKSVGIKEQKTVIGLCLIAIPQDNTMFNNLP